MKNFFAAFLIYATSSINFVEAQQVVKKDTIAGTELVMTMDSKINEALSTIEERCERSAYGKSSEDSGVESKKNTKILIPSRELTKAEICRKNPRILGYKLLVATVKSNEEANEIKAYFRKRFPNLKLETDASLRPNYKILAGSYFSKQSAAEDLAKVKEYFKSATPIKYRIFCAEAK